MEKETIFHTLWWGFLWALSRRLVNIQKQPTNQPTNHVGEIETGRSKLDTKRQRSKRWRRKRRSISNNTYICSRHAKNVSAWLNWKKHEILVKRKRNFYKSILDGIGSFTLIVINVTPPGNAYTEGTIIKLMWRGRMCIFAECYSESGTAIFILTNETNNYIPMCRTTKFCFITFTHPYSCHTSRHDSKLAEHNANKQAMMRDDTR